MPGFQNLHFHFSQASQLPATHTVRSAAERPDTIASGSTADAARYYLDRLLRTDSRPVVRGLSQAAAGQLVPDMKDERTLEIPWPFDKSRKPVFRGSGSGRQGGRSTSVVRFRQTYAEIPVFGSSAVVQLDEDRKLISADVNVADIGDAPRQPKLSDEQARMVLADLVKRPTAELGPLSGALNYVLHAGEWHLAWLYKKVPATPPEVKPPADIPGVLPGESPRFTPPRYDYLVDAMNGKILRWYVSARALNMSPVGCRGLDEDGIVCSFLGRRVANPQCIEMHDEMHRLITIDNQGNAFDVNPAAGIAVRCNSGNFGAANAAAISAHINGGKVIAFYRSVLGRNGIDGAQMPLISLVNNTAHDGDAPEWKQAQWYDNKMWYGQYKDAQGQLRSYARHLDVVAHELTHGVVEYSSQLKYWGQSGALDESFADILAVVISSYYRHGENSSADQWDWEIGAGLGPGGGPLRDLTKPVPDSLPNFAPTLDDSGGVHALSSIHTKAAHSVFTARDAAGSLLLHWMEAIFIYFVAFCALPPEADFAKARATVVEGATTFFSGLPANEQQSRIQAIEDAYTKVGIS